MRVCIIGVGTIVYMGTTGGYYSMSWIIKKATEFQKKTSTSALLTMPKPYMDHSKLWKIFKRWKYQIT